ncbi:sodium:solute symporter [Echinimonas agarilytica]|uniref:Sodium:solute symporter n=1 Tax=Echinimonas agarilytica TaxID=1215918 RepID=A0AA42B6V7_9GAMM|nr:sodium:solute symporter [Echinimonas agarilytica]MCM2679194.1 sodium:solute symporter [Echinimonas agarilytica]
MTSLSMLDWSVVAAYFLIIVAVVYFSSQQQKTTSDYFLAGRHAPWFVVGASLFASNIGSEHIVGLAGNGAINGLVMAHWELHAWVMVLLAWVFVPFYYKSGVFTMPEFLEKRFDTRSRWVLTIVSLVAYVFTKVSVTVYAGALVFKTLLPDTFGTPDNAFWVGAFATVILTGIYTVFGGLKAVLYTEVAQSVLLLIGSAFITYIGLEQLGGWGELKTMAAANADTFALWRPLSDPDFPWLGVMIASPVIGIWYWCTDQYIIQRTLAAKSLKDARRGALFGGFLKVWPVFIFLVPGLIGWALHQKGMMMIPTKGEGAIDGDQVFATMVASLLPEGLRGLVVAGLLSALMSSLASLFNSCSTLFTVDIYQRLKPESTQSQLVNVGRIATLAVVVAGMIWIPVMHKMAGGGIYKYLQSVQGYLAPPITAVFLLGLFWKRINANGAFWGMMIGFSLALAKLMLEALWDNGIKVTSLEWFIDINFLYYSGILLALSALSMVIISYMGTAQNIDEMGGATYSALTDDDKAEIRASWNRWDVIGTMIVMGLVLTIYLYFSFWLG